ncbi:copper resistance protein CopC [Nocardioides sp. 616]|uniref:copper resistance CopC/CopD family protein n=1 Tax=Nocardioides sp. 616 TaxID=2268090 RepID=UPI000CE2D576|nr:copper resistance protein CopC [Nocardioides sp. 616]
MSTQGLTLRRWPALLAAAAALLLCLLAASPAWAHAQLVGTDPVSGTVLPEAPEQVTLSFSEPVLLTSRRVTTYDAQGSVVASSASTADGQVRVVFEDRLARGTYVVAWFVVSSDGHPISGSLTFSVGERSASVRPPPPPAESSATVTSTQAVASWATYLGLLTSAGLVVFVVLVLPRRYAGRLLLARVRRLLRLAVALALVGAAVGVAVAGLYAQGLELDAVLTSFDASLVRKELGSALLLAAALVTAAAVFGSTPPGPRRSALLLTCAALAVCAPALVGHTRSYGPAPLVLGADVLHLAAGAIWLGGLAGLTLTLRSGTSDVSSRRDAEVLARFSAVAGPLVLAVAVAGVLLAWRILGSWSALVETTYGTLLLVKVALGLAVAAVAAFNRFRLLPRVRRSPFGDPSAGALVRRTVLAELALLVVLLVVTGFLVGRAPSEPPGAPAAPVPISRTLQLGGVEVEVLLTPGTSGGNTLVVSTVHTEGRSADQVGRPDVELRSSEFDLGAVPLRSDRPGKWEALVLLPRGGDWELQLGLRVGQFENPVTTLELDVPDAPGTG